MRIRLFAPCVKEMLSGSSEFSESSVAIFSFRHRRICVCRSRRAPRSPPRRIARNDGCGTDDDDDNDNERRLTSERRRTDPTYHTNRSMPEGRLFWFPRTSVGMHTGILSILYILFE